MRTTTRELLDIVDTLEEARVYLKHGLAEKAARLLEEALQRLDDLIEAFSER
jgi:hypothetical protein